MLARTFRGKTRGGDGRLESTNGMTSDALWSEVAARLKAALSDSAYRTWFGDATAGTISNGELVVAVPNNFSREWIETHFASLVRAAVSDVTEAGLSVRFRVDESLSK